MDSELPELEQGAHVSLRLDVNLEPFPPAICVVVILSVEEFMIFCNFLFLLIQQCW